MLAAALRDDSVLLDRSGVGLADSQSGIILSHALLGMPFVAITVTVFSIALLLTVELMRRRSERLRGRKAQ